jgi:hypothetical protein
MQYMLLVVIFVCTAKERALKLVLCKRTSNKKIYVGQHFGDIMFFKFLILMYSSCIICERLSDKVSKRIILLNFEMHMFAYQPK